MTVDGNEEFSADTVFKLERLAYCTQVWITTNRKIAENVAKATASGFGSSFDTPKNSFVGNLEVVDLGGN